MATRPGNGWWQRLRERGVIRVAASYAVIAWLLLQIADVTFEPLGVPRWVMVSLIVAALVGFPIAVALAWFYEVGDRGVERDTARDGSSRPVTHGVRRYADVAIIAVLVVAVAVLLVRQSRVGGDDGAQTVAVLPFENLSRADDGEVLALGIAEAVLHQLANLAQLEVISRTSSFAFRERSEDAREIGKQLGARYLLEGSVQSDRTRMRVTTQLIDARTGSDVWSMRFDRPPGDVFAVQDEIAMQVARALELSLDANATDRLTGQGTSNLDAYLAYGVASISPGETVRLYAVTVGIPEAHPAELVIRDRLGHVLVQSSGRLLPGRAVALDLSFDAHSIAVVGNRLEFQAEVRFAKPGKGYVIPSLEVIEDATGRTIRAIVDPIG